MERSDKKLTLLQKGALQKTFAFLVYACIASSLAFLLDHIDKYTFLSLIERACNEGLIVKENFPVLQQLFADVVEIPLRIPSMRHYFLPADLLHGGLSAGQGMGTGQRP